MMATVLGEIKIIVPKWRVRASKAILWPVRFLPERARDRIADALAPHLARWIVSGARIG